MSSECYDNHKEKTAVKTMIKKKQWGEINMIRNKKM